MEKMEKMKKGIEENSNSSCRSHLSPQVSNLFSYNVFVLQLDFICERNEHQQVFVTAHCNDMCTCTLHLLCLHCALRFRISIKRLFQDFTLNGLSWGRSLQFLLGTLMKTVFEQRIGTFPPQTGGSNA